MEQLLLTYLTSGDFPLELRMRNKLSFELKSLVDKCTQKLYEEGTLTEEKAKDFLFNI